MSLYKYLFINSVQGSLSLFDTKLSEITFLVTISLCWFLLDYRIVASGESLRNVVLQFIF